MAHRNIQPKNIIVSHDFKKIELIGFQLCCNEKNENVYTSKGDFPYFRGRDHPWFQSSIKWDLFSFSIVAFELLYPTNEFKYRFGNSPFNWYSITQS